MGYDIMRCYRSGICLQKQDVYHKMDELTGWAIVRECLSWPHKVNLKIATV